MAITERTRHTLYQRLEKILGEEEATTLMEHLPPVGWADVATKTDLASLEHRLEAKIDQSALALHREFSSFKDEMHRDRQTGQRQMMFVLVGIIVSVAVSIATSF